MGGGGRGGEGSGAEEARAAQEGSNPSQWEGERALGVTLVS